MEITKGVLLNKNISCEPDVRNSCNIVSISAMCKMRQNEHFCNRKKCMVQKFTMLTCPDILI